jgi:hypothetical protein
LVKIGLIVDLSSLSLGEFKSVVKLGYLSVAVLETLAEERIDLISDA